MILLNDDQIFWKITTIQSIFEPIYTFNNRTIAIIMNQDQKESLLTNSIFEILSKIKINSFIHNFLLSMIETHLLNFNYYANFELQLFLNITVNIIKNKDDFNSKEELIYYLEETLELIKGRLKNLIIINDESISLLKKNPEFYLQFENKNFIKIFEYLINNQHLIRDKYPSIKLIKTSKEYEGIKYFGTSIKINKQTSNIIQLCDYHEINFPSSGLNLILLEYEDIEGLIKNEESFHSNVNKRIKSDQIVLTNGILNNRLFDLFISKNIFIVHNIKKKILVNLSKSLGIPIANSTNIFQIINDIENLLSQKLNDFNASVRNFSCYLVQKLYFKSKNEIYLIFHEEKIDFLLENRQIIMCVHSSSQIQFNKLKNSLKSNLVKLRNIIKYRKILLGAGNVEFTLAEYLRAKAVKEKEKKSLIFAFILEIIADAVQRIGEILYINEGYTFEEIGRQFKKKEILFYDEYKGKKFSFENAFLFVNSRLEAIEQIKRLKQKKKKKNKAKQIKEEEGKLKMFVPKIIYAWLFVSSIIVTWDFTFILFRPLSLPGNPLHFLWSPYALYINIDLMYGNLEDIFVVVQAIFNIAEIILNLLSLFLLSSNKTNNKIIGSILCLITACFTFWKTCIYFVYGKNFINWNVGKVKLIFLYFIPNGIWIVVPFLIIFFVSRNIFNYVLEKEKIEEKASSKKKN